MPVLGAHILVVDDDERLRTLLAQYLGEHGFFVSTAANTEEADQVRGAFTCDVLVLDIMMPGETGLDYAARLNREGGVIPPILLLTARAEAEDRIAGLEAGAADYLAKPFAPRELLLRLENLLKRRPVAEPVVTRDQLRFGDYAFNLTLNQLTRAGQPLYLTSSELDCLRILAESAGVPVSRERMAELLGDVGNARSVDVQINRLRKKIEPIPAKPLYLQTIRHAGYVLYAQAG